MIGHVLVLALSLQAASTDPVILAARRGRPKRPARSQKVVKPDPKPEPAPAPVETPAPAPTPARTAAAASQAEGKSPDGVLDAAEAACKSLDFDICVDLATQALARKDITEEQQARAYTIQGAAYAVVGQAVEAERPYRLLLRIRPDFDLPKDTPPKILAVFRKVQAEENEIRQAVKAAARRKLIQSIKLAAEAPATHKGGTPLQIYADVTDPMKGIQSITLEYRMDKEMPFASIPFQSSPQGPLAEFSAAQMSTDQPLKLEYVIIARDGDGEVLMAVHSAEQPGTINVEAGQVAGPPVWKQPRMWGLAAAGSAALAGGGALLTAALAGAAGTIGTVVFLLVRGDGVIEEQTKLGSQDV